MSQHDFEMGKKMLLDSLHTLLNLYVNFYLGISLLGLDLPTIDDKFKMGVEKARASKITLDALISSLEKAQNVDEIQAAIEESEWLGRLFKGDVEGL